MKKSVLSCLFIALVLGGTVVEGENNSFGYKEATHPKVITPGNVFGAGNINGLLPGVIYLSFSAGPSPLMGNIIGSTSGAASLGKSNMASIGLSRVFRNHVGYELSFMYGQYDASDAGSLLNTPMHNYNTSIGELSLTAQWYLLGGPYSGQFQTLYLLGGIGALCSHFDSERKEPDCYHLIYKNSTFSPTIPFGACYMLGGHTIQLGVEVTEHFAFSDYLQGVKTDTGSNLANDFLAHFALKLRVRLYQDNKFE